MSEPIRMKFDAHGLIPAIVQDDATGEVLMLAYMNEKALAKTLASGSAWFFSRSRGKLWMKGESSGHTQRVSAVFYDCDADAILIKVSQTGAACHEGYRSCFFRELDAEGQWKTNAERIVDPEQVYGKPSTGRKA